MDFEKLFKEFSDIKVVVFGDVMLDTYWWGNVERISPEAPVPVVAIKSKELRIGGAGNVALNCASLGSETYIFSVIGNDDDGTLLKNLLAENNINTEYLVVADNRITTNKIRIVSRNQQMVRLDLEEKTDILEAEQKKVLESLRRCFEKVKPDVLIFEDYNKGVLTQALIEAVIALCKEFGILTAVDPKQKNFFTYKGVDIFKPNLKEVKDGLNHSFDEINLQSLQEIHQLLNQKLNHQISLITLSEHGVFYQTPTGCKLIPTHIRNISDVSGAGDTVIAAASVVYAATRNISIAAEIANIAGGLVCEEVGTVALNKQHLLNESKLLLGNS